LRHRLTAFRFGALKWREAACPEGVCDWAGAVAVPTSAMIFATACSIALSDSRSRAAWKLRRRDWTASPIALRSFQISWRRRWALPEVSSTDLLFPAALAAATRALSFASCVWLMLMDLARVE
jgi:hypothetical protein